jgi:glutathione S-transferase
MGGKPVLYDVPVSNNGARCRIIIYKKGIEDQISIKSPQDIGGLKSAEYLKLNPQGKMPLLVADDIVLPESDTISRYLLDRFSNSAPSFVPTTLAARARSDLLCRLHDMYEPSSFSIHTHMHSAHARTVLLHGLTTIVRGVCVYVLITYTGT